MPASQHVMVTCDAPACSEMLQTDEGRVLFETEADALALAEDSGWLVTHQYRDDTEAPKTYCPRHWHRQFGVRTPYWGDRPNRRRR